MIKPRVKLVTSFCHAIDGVVYVVVHERNAQIHFIVSLAVLALSFWLQLSLLEWALVLLAIGLVFTSEMFNTVVELLVDLSTQEIHPLAKHAKDVAAGSVLLMAIVSAAIGFLVLGPPLLDRLSLMI
ncbi:MAG: diacylglycerol kinase family protein [Anaerolineae bacterium]